jgi:glycosyltransferase involved in cell wall biosynthesis
VTAPVRVLVPYLSTYFGGVRRILGVGFPALPAAPTIEVTYAELCGNDGDMDAMAAAGVRVERGVGVPGRSALSTARGLRRLLDLGGQGPRLARIAWRLGRRLAAHDVCWVHGHRELLLAIAGRAAARASPPAPIVWHWHGPPLSLEVMRGGTPAERWIARLASRNCARVVAVSDFCARQATELGLDPALIVTVPNAAAVEPPGPLAAEAAPLPARAPGDLALLVACASLRPHKGVHLAIEALAALPPHVVLWVTGDVADPVARAYVGALRATAARLGVHDRVRFVGARRDVHVLMAAADAVLVPSTWDEPFGLVAAEAQLLGVPVIASSRGALPELLAGGRFGLVFDPARPGALAAAVSRLAQEPGLGERLAGAARSHAAERYGYARWSAEVARVLEEAARGGPRARPERGREVA